MAQERSDILPGTLTAGPYVIRNRMTSTVLHMEYSDVYGKGYNVLEYKQNESQFNDQQIWWIEPLAEYGSEDEKPNDGLVYSITNPASGRSLDANPENGNVCTWVHHGDPWQRWRLRKAIDPIHGEICYTIINFFNDKVVDIVGKPPSGAKVTTNPSDPTRQEQFWDFLIPVVAFPLGWFHIENVGTRDLLRQNYVYNSPMLLPPPNPPKQSQHQEQWDFQWALVHSQCFEPSTADDRNSWCIINRRTRARLSPQFGNIKKEHLADRFQNLAWRLELDASYNWKIINHKSSCLLEQTTIPFNGGTAVSCSDQQYNQKGGNQSWILKPPLLHTGDVPPPEYEDTKT